MSDESRNSAKRSTITKEVSFVSFIKTSAALYEFDKKIDIPSIPSSPQPQPIITASSRPGGEAPRPLPLVTSHYRFQVLLLRSNVRCYRRLQPAAAGCPFWESSSSASTAVVRSAGFGNSRDWLFNTLDVQHGTKMRHMWIYRWNQSKFRQVVNTYLVLT